MKPPELIKKGLEGCGVLDGDCENCPYDDGPQLLCVDRLRKDALAYIQQLEETVAKQCEKYKRLLETASILSDALNEMDRRD